MSKRSKLFDSKRWSQVHELDGRAIIRFLKILKETDQKEGRARRDRLRFALRRASHVFFTVFLIQVTSFLAGATGEAGRVPTPFRTRTYQGRVIGKYEERQALLVRDSAHNERILLLNERIQIWVGKRKGTFEEIQVDDLVRYQTRERANQILITSISVFRSRAKLVKGP